VSREKPFMFTSTPIESILTQEELKEELLEELKEEKEEEKEVIKEQNAFR